MLQAWFTGVAPSADPFLVLLAALAVDAAFGDPEWLYRLVSHPAVIFGRCIDAGDRWLYGAEAMHWNLQTAKRVIVPIK